MIVDDLVRKILTAPYKRGADHLKVLTGYATAAMAKRHLIQADEIASDPQIQLPELSVEVVYGMSERDGIPLTQHQTFVDMSTSSFKGRFSCHYVVDPPPVHSKVYVWCRAGEPIEAFLGSANYTQTALMGHQIESMTRCDTRDALALFDENRARSLECEHDDVETSVALYQHDDNSMNELENVNLPFLVQITEETPTTSGINWGQRAGRDRNQAYLRVPSETAQSDFFPPRAVQFTMLTDDGFSMLCAVAQDGDKAIHTVESNAILGKYVRSRLGLHDGACVRGSHFDDYGRDDVTVHKIDDETYYLDFSV